MGFNTSERGEEVAAQGQAADDLAAFDQSDKMMDIRNILRISANEGNVSTVIGYGELGTSRELVFIITLLRQHGYKVEHSKNVIIVK